MTASVLVTGSATIQLKFRMSRTFFVLKQRLIILENLLSFVIKGLAMGQARLLCHSYKEIHCLTIKAHLPVPDIAASAPTLGIMFKGIRFLCLLLRVAMCFSQ